MGRGPHGDVPPARGVGGRGRGRPLPHLLTAPERCEACGRWRHCVNGVCPHCRRAADIDHAEQHQAEEWDAR